MRCVGWLGLAAVWLVPDTALADVSAAAFGGYGLPKEADGTDVFRAGFGARVGYTFPLPVYFGVASTFHLGSRDPEPNVSTKRVSYHGAEAGFDFTLGEFGVRPYALGGAAKLTLPDEPDGGFWSPYLGAGLFPWWTFAKQPGLEGFVGLDVRFLLLTTPLSHFDESRAFGGFPVYLAAGARL